MESRKTERVASINLAEIEAEGSGLREYAHMACTLDMSSHGARLIITSSRPATFHIEGDVRLTIALEDSLVKLRGHAVRSSRRSDRETVLGVRFCEVDKDQLELVGRLLERRSRRKRVHA